MQFAVQKVKDSDNNCVLITERGSQFGYHELVVDFKGIPFMQEYAPVVMDVTHSLQKLNQSCGIAGGQPQLIETIAKAAIASGVDGIFIESGSGWSSSSTITRRWTNSRASVPSWTATTSARV